ncbi:MAG: hypothetical protein NZM18_09555 [Thermoflexales bacterium]|nr:hypothetical protein [Thermoflexales bacterium]MDW8352736.1 hypothetical protein [Anaerolineae bacterium]
MNGLIWTPRLLLAALSVGLGALSLGLALRDAAIFIPIFIALGAAWAYTRHRGRHSIAAALANLTLTATVIGAGVGLLIGAWSALMLASVGATLAAWDLTHFERRMRALARVERAGDIERRHLRWLGAATVGGVILAGLALTIRTTLSFAVVFAVGLLAALALSGMIGALRRE